MTSVRWDKKKKEALAHLFLDGAIQLDETAPSVHKKYAQLWGGIKLDNFSKHFRDIKKPFIRKVNGLHMQSLKTSLLRKEMVSKTDNTLCMKKSHITNN